MGQADSTEVVNSPVVIINISAIHQTDLGYTETLYTPAMSKKVIKSCQNCLGKSIGSEI